MNMTSKLYTLNEVAELMSVHPRTVKNWGKDGKINIVITPGGKYRVPAAEVERLMKGANDGEALAQVVD